MKRVCPRCGEERDVESEFRWRYKQRGIRQKWCKYCQAEAMKVHYRDNKQIYMQRAITRNAYITAENRRLLLAYLSEHPCIDCGNSDIRCLEFDHVSGNKASSISALLMHSSTWPAIETEIGKCEVRCVNCHRIKTYERRR